MLLSTCNQGSTRIGIPEAALLERPKCTIHRSLRVSVRIDREHDFFFLPPTFIFLGCSIPPPPVPGWAFEKTSVALEKENDRAPLLQLHFPFCCGYVPVGHIPGNISLPSPSYSTSKKRIGTSITGLRACAVQLGRIRCPSSQVSSVLLMRISSFFLCSFRWSLFSSFSSFFFASCS